MRQLLLLLCTLVMTGYWAHQPVLAADEIVTFDDPEQREMYFALLKEYRCLKCQNQNLADSNASLAGDLRREIRDQILAGKQPADIDEYLVARYGDFVLYRPRFSSKTAVLWIGPFALLMIALGGMVLMVRRRKQVMADGSRPIPVESEEHLRARLDKAKRLLDD